MRAHERLRAELGAAVSGAGGAVAVADRLCRACVDLLQVDGAAISLMVCDADRGTLGSSSSASRHLEELQFVYGEGPGLDAVHHGRPVLVADLAASQDRWPLFAGDVLAAGVRALFTLPVRLGAQPVGALDLFRNARGPLSERALAGGMWAAELAALPLLDLMAAHAGWNSAGQLADGWYELASLDRVEVYQATGMIMGAVGVEATEALVRLRAHAFARGLTTGQAAWAIVEREVALDREDWQEPGRQGPYDGASR